MESLRNGVIVGSEETHDDETIAHAVGTHRCNYLYLGGEMAKSSEMGRQPGIVSGSMSVSVLSTMSALGTAIPALTAVVLADSGPDTNLFNSIGTLNIDFVTHSVLPPGDRTILDIQLKGGLFGDRPLGP